MAKGIKPAALFVLDGWGIAPPHRSNGVTQAKTPFINTLIDTYPTFLLEASGLSVGLPWGEVGNSEVGHMNLGSGVLFYQSLPRINQAIKDKSFCDTAALSKAKERVTKNKSKLHLIGLIGRGGVHAHQEHFYALIDYCKKYKIKKNIYIHLFLDGRDASQDGGLFEVKEVLKYCKKARIGEIASVSGRFFAMDRNNNWDRIQKAYNTIACGKSESIARDPIKAIEESYANKVYDEEFIPTVIVNRKDEPLATIDSKDAVVFFNFRADRARQLSKAFVLPEFKEFDRPYLKNLLFVTFTEYEKGLPTQVIFPPQLIKNPIAKVISKHGLKQIHAAETEKYAHVTFFFNGACEEPFVGEERLLVDSPLVTSYAEKPEMSAQAVTNKLLQAIKMEKYSFYVTNFANPDMVGHTGDLQATITAIQTVDNCMKQIIPEMLKRNIDVYIVSDHGNAEELVNLATGKMDKEHSVYPVPLIIASSRLEGKKIITAKNGDLSGNTSIGVLTDVAPTILKQMGLPIPKEMTGANLLGKL